MDIRTAIQPCLRRPAPTFTLSYLVGGKNVVRMTFGSLMAVRMHAAYLTRGGVTVVGMTDPFGREIK